MLQLQNLPPIAFGAAGELLSLGRAFRQIRQPAVLGGKILFDLDQVRGLRTRHIFILRGVVDFHN